MDDDWTIEFDLEGDESAFLSYEFLVEQAELEPEAEIILKFLEQVKEIAVLDISNNTEH